MKQKWVISVFYMCNSMIHILASQQKVCSQFQNQRCLSGMTVHSFQCCLYLKMALRYPPWTDLTSLIAKIRRYLMRFLFRFNSMSNKFSIYRKTMVAQWTGICISFIKNSHVRNYKTWTNTLRRNVIYLSNSA